MTDTSADVMALRHLLDRIAVTYGSLVNDLARDPETRQLLALQLAHGGVRIGPPTPPAADDPALEAVVGGLQEQVDALWRELRAVKQEQHVRWRAPGRTP